MSRQAQFRYLPRDLLSLLIGLSLCAFSFSKLSNVENHLAADIANKHEVLYMPKAEAVKLLSFGYANTLSSILWFNTISYFGKHYASDRNYEWLYHMCDLVTQLDPRKKAAYEFCATMLAWEAQSPERSVSVLTRAIENYPGDWRLYYMRGFVQMYFRSDARAAQADFAHGAALPDADNIMARLAAKQLVDLGDAQTALKFLEDMLRRAQNEPERQALLQRWKETRYELDFDRLEQALRIYKESFGRAAENLDQLVSAGIVSALPPDPFGGSYFLDQAGKLRSSSGHKRLSQKIRKTFSEENAGG